jgi:hypothetical protein
MTGEPEPDKAGRDVADIFRPLPEEREHEASSSPLLVGPALVLLGIVGFLFPIFGEATFLIAILLLALGPAVLSLGWRPGGNAARAATVTAATAALLTSAAAGLGLLANPCAYDPISTALTSATMTVVTFVLAVLLGRSLASRGLAVAAVLGAGTAAFGGFFATAYIVLPKVFVLC